MPLMDYITVWILGAANSTDPLGPKFNGSRGELLMTFAICGLVILFGFIVFVAGLWQLILGRRNKIFVWSVAGLGAVLFAVAGYFYWAN